MELGKFLKQRDIIYTLCAASISAQIVIIADALTSSCIIPIMNRQSSTERTVENFVVDMGGAKIELGKIIIAIIRLIIVMLILYTAYYFMY